MKISSPNLLAVTLSLGAVVVFPATAASLDCAPITSVPVVIAVPGEYCLVDDLTFPSARGAAITVTVSDVTVDLNRNELRGPHYGGVTTIAESIAISANDVSNVTVRNGAIAGFATGVSFRSSLPLKTGMLVEDLHLSGITAVAIQIGTASTVVRNNRITNLNGTLKSGVASDEVTAIYSENIWGMPMGNEIRNNFISGMKGGANSGIIKLFRAPSTLVEGNTIAGPNYDSFTGIRIGASRNVTVANNRFSNMKIGIDYQYEGVGKYYGNITEGVGSPYVGIGTNLGNNF